MFQLPSFWEIAITLSGWLWFTTLEFACSRIFGTRGRYDYVWRATTMNLVLLFVRPRPRLVLISVWLVLLFLRRFPWRRYGKRIGASVGSLTEIARACFQRQQRETFG